MKKIILSIIAVLVLASFLAAMNEATTGAQFLKINVGGKATAMGGAFTAIADDASAMYYNPAGIVKLNKMNIMFNYVKWPADITYSYVGFTTPLGMLGTMGIQAGFLTMPPMEVTTVEEWDGTGETFTYMSYFVGMSYARYFTDKLAIGFTGKLIQEMIWDASSQMMAVDVGATYYTGFKSLRIGMAVRNFGSEGQFTGGTVLTDQWDRYEEGTTPVNVEIQTEPYPIPLNFNFGVAYDILEGPASYMTAAFEFQNPSDGPENMKLGLEYNFNRMLFVRLGYGINIEEIMDRIDEMGDLTMEEKAEGLTAGLGFKLNVTGFDVNVDYSYTGMGKLGDNFMNGHRVVLGVAF